jgi:hypothetical protein
MTRRSSLVSLSIAVLGLFPTTTGVGKDSIGIIRSDADYDKIADHSKPPDPREVKKLVGYILEGMSRAHSADGQTRHLGKGRLLDHYLNRFIDRHFLPTKTRGLP